MNWKKIITAIVAVLICGLFFPWVPSIRYVFSLLAAAGLAILIARTQKQSENNRKFRSVGIILVAVSAALTVTSMILLAADAKDYSSEVVMFFENIAKSVAPLIFAVGLTIWLLSAKSGKKIRNIGIIGIILVAVGIVSCVLHFLYRFLFYEYLGSMAALPTALIESGEMLLVAYGLSPKDKKQKSTWRCFCGAVNKKDDAFCSVCGAPRPKN